MTPYAVTVPKSISETITFAAIAVLMAKHRLILG
jgi:hypothetical protein